MRLFKIIRSYGRITFINMERVIFISIHPDQKEYVFYFDGPERSVGAHADEYDRISQFLAQYAV